MSDICGLWGGCVLPKGHNMGYCQDYERYELWVEQQNLLRKQKELRDLRELAKKYGYALKKIDPKFGDE